MHLAPTPQRCAGGIPDGTWSDGSSGAFPVTLGSLTGVSRAILFSSPLVGDYARVAATVRNDAARTLTFNSISMRSINPNGVSTDNFCGNGERPSPRADMRVQRDRAVRIQGHLPVYPPHRSGRRDAVGWPHSSALTGPSRLPVPPP